ncbi:MAG: tripartite tricarboxylate transporter permease, partial [Candidatus Hydrothermarchaeaceae archaeon]
PKYALFPTLTGLFGISTLLTSLRTNPKIPEQRVDYEGGIYPGGIVIGTIGGILTGLLPSIGSSQSAMIIQNFFRKKDEKTFLVALGGVNTSDAVYALFALYLIGNPRSGASIAVEYILEVFTFQDFLFMISVVLMSAFFGVTITLLMARFFVGKSAELNYHSFSKYIIAFVLTLIFLITGWRGLLVALTATAIGLITPVAGIKRSHCMAVLVVPTIFYFL